MNPFFLLVMFALGGLALYESSGVAETALNLVSNSSGDGPAIMRNNPWNIPDVDSANQSGTYSTTYDENFEDASGATGVPFALIKAHAIRESSLSATAYHFDNSTVGASYGLMQVEWIAGSNRFSKYGFTDAQIGDGSLLYDPATNALIGASIIKDNLNWLMPGGVFKAGAVSLRDVINAYNTGTIESKIEAPANYVNDVIAYYTTLIAQSPLS